MLVLTRNCGEGIVIKHGGEELVLKISKGNGKRIKMMIDGPRSFDISRDSKPSADESEFSRWVDTEVYARVMGSQWLHAKVVRARKNKGVLYFDVQSSDGTIHQHLMTEDIHEIKGEHA